MPLRALLLIAVTLAGFGFHARTDASAFSGSADTRLLRLAAVGLKHDTMRQVLEWLQHQSGVRSAAHDGSTLGVLFRDGTRGVILPAWRGRVRAIGALRRRFRPLSHTHSPVGRALVLEPFAAELGLGPSAGDPEVHQLQHAGYQVDQLYDTAVSVKALTSISQYNVVYMHTHSDPFGGGDGVVATGQLANDDVSVGALLQDGSVVKVGVSGSNDIYYAITSTFIRQHEGFFPSHVLVFLNGCSLLKAPVFWQALSGKGVGVMVSWDLEATSQDNYLSGAAFFAELGQGLTVSAAIQAEKAAGYGSSNVNGQKATLGYLGDGSITLSSAATPAPTSTPVPAKSTPTHTPVPARATSTPTQAATATATPIPPLPLSVQLEPRVEPGSRQVILMRSMPDTILHIRVLFPDGEGRSATTATDGSGNARFVYLQHPDRITYNQLFATVTVQAVKGAATAAQTLHYRIGWAPIDVSVQPRVQAVSHLVRVWVHTQSSRTTVVIALQFPKKGQVKKFQTRTGARGWASVAYRIGHYLKSGANHTVVVRARARVGGTVRHAETTFAIV